MQTYSYITILLIVVVLAIMVLVRLYRRSIHLRNMAEFYRKHHWVKEPEQGVYCSISINDDPLENIGYVSGVKIEREIKEIIKRFKKDTNLLKDTEKDYYDLQQRKAIEQEIQRKRLIAKRVFAYDYEELLFQIYKPTAKEKVGGWDIEVMSRNEIIQRISEIKGISSNEAEKIFKILVEHDLIWHFGGKYKLSPMLRNGNTGWDIVSNIDMNFEKWMVAQNYEKSNK